MKIKNTIRLVGMMILVAGYLSAPVQAQVTDIDGNTYDIIEIGTQFWLKQNLKVTKYRDGTAITTSLNDTDWGNNITGAYAVHPNGTVNDYGLLYN